MSMTPKSQQALLPPFSPQHLRRDSVTSEQTAKPVNTKILQIKNLLNPMNTSRETYATASPASTPAYTVNEFTPTPTPGPETPLTPASTRKQKTGKDHATSAKRAAPKGAVNYKSYGCNSNSVCADPALRTEIINQHANFKVAAEGNGLISDYPKHIPYASGKKDFYDKTGREAFEFFQYTFVVPNDPTQKVHSVMWDYQVGLVRITPFFKAFGYGKTTPAKAIKTNPGLENLVHSITGGALQAQGYWAPFACARALCLTFCWDIRWVLTPVFGPSFVTECLPPGDPNYKRWKIDNSIVRRDGLQAEGWRLQASRSATPASPAVGSTYTAPNIPMYQPPTSAPTSNSIHVARPQRERLVFKEGSPFSPDAASSHRGRPLNLDTDDCDISPKSSPARNYPGGWTSINQRATPPSVPRNTPVGGIDRSLQLLTQPIDRFDAQESSWRSLNNERSASPASMPAPKHTTTKKRPNRKRVSPQTYDEDNEIVVVSDSSYKSSPASSESSAASASPPPPPPKKVKLNTHRRRPPFNQDEQIRDDGVVRSREPEHTELDPEVVRAAEILMGLYEEDKTLRRQ